MSEWKECKLGEVVEITSSKRVFYSEYVSFGIPFFRSKEIIEKHNKNDVSTELYISDEKYKEIKTNYGVPKEGDILLTSVGTLGIPYVVQPDDKFYFKDGNLTWFRNFSKELLNKYLYYFLISSTGKQKLDEIKIGSTQEALTIVGLKSIEVLLPPLLEQKAIVEVLASLDDKIDLLNRQNKTLEAMAETLFRQWFVEEAEDDWEEGCLEDIIEFNPKYKLDKENEAPYLKMSNVSTTSYCPIDWYDREFNSGVKFKNGDTLIARITPCLENGKTCFVDFLDNEKTVSWGSTEFIVMRMKKRFHPFISYIIAKNEDFRNFAVSCMTGSSGRQRAQANDIKEYNICIPPNDVIDKLNIVLSGFVKKLKNNSEQIRTLEKIRDIMLPKLISGEVWVLNGCKLR